MTESFEITATLKKSDNGNGFVFELPEADEYKKVKCGDKVSWKVTAQDLNADPGELDTRVNLLLEFHGSNSETPPPQGEKGKRNWPFEANAWREAEDPNDSTQYRFAVGFRPWEKDGSGYVSTSTPMTVSHDGSMQNQRIVYNYTLLAWIPKNQLPPTIPPNSNDGMHQWPKLTYTGSKYRLVKRDPEMYVDEC